MDKPHADLTHALGEVVEALALPPDATGDFAGTPERAAKAWTEAFLSGYRVDPRALLGSESVMESAGRARGSELVVVRDLPFFGMCPHHLLPFTGRATVAYIPGARLVGFGRLGDLVNCFTRRFTLQERACRQVADALMEYLGAEGSGCVMTGEHTCLRIPGQRPQASVVSAAFRGLLERRHELQVQVLS